MFSNEKGLFLEAKKSRYLPHIVIVFFLIVIFLLGGQLLSALFITFTPLKSILYQMSGSSVGKALYLFVSFVFILLLVFIWVKFVEKRRIQSLGLYKEGFLKNYMLGFLVGLVLMTGAMIILYFTGHIKVNANAPMTGLSMLGSILLILPGWMVQSATEEILFRGWTMNVIGARYNAYIGIGISSILFGLGHSLNPGISILAVINLILVAVFFALYAIKSQNLWGVCGVHAAWNWAQGNIFGLEVSGNTTTQTIVDLDPVGSDIFTGGAFGPEGGIAVTIVLCIGIFIVLMRKKSVLKHS